MAYKGIISFDLDGTLISTNPEAKSCFLNAFQKTFDISNFKEPNFKGGVDLAILSNLCKENEIKLNKKQIRQFIKNYIFELENKTNPKKWLVFDYVTEFLNFLKELGFLIVLVSGNYYETGFIKLAQTSLNKYFSFFALNSVELTRIDLMRKIITFANEKNQKVVAHFGDDFSDIMASVHFNIPAFLFLPDVKISSYEDFLKKTKIQLTNEKIKNTIDKIQYIFDLYSFDYLNIDNVDNSDTKKIGNILFIYNSYKLLFTKFENLIKSSILDIGG